MNKKLNFILGRVGNIVGKGENAGNQHFLLFLQCFQRLLCQGHLKPALCDKGLMHYGDRLSPFFHRAWLMHFVFFQATWMQVQCPGAQFWGYGRENRDPHNLLAQGLKVSADLIFPPPHSHSLFLSLSLSLFPPSPLSFFFL